MVAAPQKAPLAHQKRSATSGGGNDAWQIAPPISSPVAARCGASAGIRAHDRHELGSLGIRPTIGALFGTPC